jgi:hypothetical protein
MATLYTPAPQREGLDWLAGMVRDGQQLWQNQARIAQQQKSLQMQAQQQHMAEQHFWANQARLKSQEDFQNRKFLYEMKQDQRDYSFKEKDFGLREKEFGRREAVDKYSMDPNSPEAQERAARTQSYRASATQTNAETEKRFGGQPKVTTWWKGETGTQDDVMNSVGGLLVPGQSMALSPDQAELAQSQGFLSPKQAQEQGKPFSKIRVHLDDGNIVERQWDDVTRADLKGRWDFYGDDKGNRDPNDGKKVVGFSGVGSDKVIPVGRTGTQRSEPATPPGMNLSHVQTNEYGDVVSRNYTLPRATDDPREEKASKLRDDLRAAQNSVKLPPSYPSGPAGEKPSAEALSAYKDKVEAVKDFNTKVQADIIEIRNQLNATLGLPPVATPTTKEKPPKAPLNIYQ